MGLVHVNAVIESPSKPGEGRTVKLLVDTGSLFSMLPASALEALGIKRTEKVDLETASGEIMYRDMGYAWIRCDGRQALTPVIFGEVGDASLLGVVTLEILRMEVDPVRNEIRPVPGKMY